MPRKGRPRPGTTTGNRSDLQQAPSVPTGQPYGNRQQLESAQRAMPLPGPGSATAAPAPPTGDPMAAAAAHDFQPVNIGAPSARPDEPVTHGLPTGPGAGPEALAMGQPMPGAGMSDLLDRLAAETGVPTLAALAQRARELGQ